MADAAQVGFIPFARPDIDEAEIEAVAEVMRSGWITTGPKVAQFEQEFGAYVGCRHALAVNSCTAAMHLALEAMGVGEDDEVITSPYTFASTAAVVEHLRARPVLVDVEADTLNIDPSLIAQTVTPRTKVILPVHFGGHPADMEGVYQVAAARGLAVLEDCAHAFPASYQGRLIGADWEQPRLDGVQAHAACFSFYATKTLTTAEGGMLCTESPQIAERARMMSLHGLTNDAWKRYSQAGSWFYEVMAPGFKYNLTDMVAAMGLVQLAKAERMREKRRAIAATYCEAFSSLEGLQLPTERAEVDHAWHIFPLRLDLQRLPIGRAEVVERLKSRGVGTSVHFIPLHLHPFYAQKYGYVPEDFPVAFREYQREVSLPIYSSMTCADIEHVIAAVTDIVSASVRS